MTEDVTILFEIDTGRDGFSLPGDDYTARLASFSGDRGFEYNPMFSFKDGAARVKLRNDDQALHGLVNLNQPVRFSAIDKTAEAGQYPYSDAMFNYNVTGTWEIVTTPLALSGTYTRNSSNTSEITFSFIGTGIQFHIFRSSTREEININIDGVDYQVSTYAAALEQYSTGVYQAGAYGVHNVTMTKVSGSYLDLDAVSVYGTRHTLWSGFIDSYERETGASAAFLNLSCADGMTNIRALHPYTELYENKTTAEILTDLFRGYTSPSKQVWLLGRSILGSTTWLGGTSLDIIGDASRTPTLTVFIPGRSQALKEATRVNKNTVEDVASAIEDLLNIDGSVLYLDADGNPHMIVYKGALTTRMYSGTALSLDTGANKSIFRSVALRQIVTEATAKYETKVALYGAVAVDDTGVKLDSGASHTFSIPIKEDVFITGTVFTGKVEAAGSTSVSVALDENNFSVIVTNTSGAENQVSRVSVLTEAYKFTENSFTRSDLSLQSLYGVRPRVITNTAIETELQATSLANRVINYNGRNLDRIKRVVFEKRFIQELLALELADILNLSESSSAVTALPHMITGFDYTWSPNSFKCEMTVEVIEPRMWVLGSSILGTETYL